MVTVFLVNGVKLQGFITYFDDQVMLLRRDDQTQLIYKHAISTVMPSVSVSLSDIALTTAESEWVRKNSNKDQKEKDKKPFSFCYTLDSHSDG